MTIRRATQSYAAILAIAILAACGGGGSSVPMNSQPAAGRVTQSAQAIGVTFAGTQTLAMIRSTRGLASTPVTVTVNGTVVGTGTLDGNGHAKITFTVPVAPGSTITITAGHLVVTATLAMGTTSTAVLVTVKADGTITVATAADNDGDGMVEPNDTEQESEDEDDKGNPTSVNANDGNVLPANLPFTLVSACGTITLTPTGAAVAFIKFQEKGSDGESDDAGRFKFEGAFTAPLTFPLVASAARLHIEIFDAQHKRLVEVKAPLSAFTSGAPANPSPCPSPSATASPSPRPSASATASPSPSPSPR